MPDDFSKKGVPDSKRINIKAAWEVVHWCEKLGCTQAQLKEAVAAAGDSVEAVKKHLGKK
jgi:hypothetical protein